MPQKHVWPGIYAITMHIRETPKKKKGGGGGEGGNKMDTNVIEHQKRDQENEITDFGKVGKHPSAEGQQHTLRIS